MEKISPSIGYNRKYIYWGIFFLIVQILAIMRNMQVGFLNFFWYCDFAPGVFSILFFLKTNQAIKGFLSIGLIPQLIYIFSMIYYAFSGTILFGFDLENLGALYFISTFIIHLSSILALIAVYRVKPKKIALLYSLIFLAIIQSIVITFIFANNTLSGNYNYIYSPGNLSLPYYTQLWTLIAFVILAIPTYLIQKIIYNKLNPKLRDKNKKSRTEFG